MEQKATVMFDVLADSSRPCVIAGELLPHTEQEHSALAELLNEKTPPMVSVDFKNANGVLSYVLTFSRPVPKKAAKK